MTINKQITIDTILYTLSIKPAINKYFIDIIASKGNIVKCIITNSIVSNVVNNDQLIDIGLQLLNKYLKENNSFKNEMIQLYHCEKELTAILKKYNVTIQSISPYIKDWTERDKFKLILNNTIINLGVHQ